MRPHGLCDVEPGPRIGRLGSDIEEQRTVRAEHACRRGDPSIRPFQVIGAREGVAILVVVDAKVVGRGSHDDVDGARGQLADTYLSVSWNADGSLELRFARARAVRAGAGRAGRAR